MKKFYLVFLLLALLLSSCNSFLDTKKEVITNTGNKINPNSKLGKEKIRQDNLLKKNIANEKIKKINEEKQKKIQEEYSKKSTEENLILAKATNEKNTDLCKTITIPDIKESCENNLIIIKAVDSNNGELCNSFKDNNLKDICFANIVSKEAEKAKDIKICQKIQKSELRKNCEENITSPGKIKSMCDGITDAKIKATCNATGK